ncbi:hypothetical protein Val02_75870 [Virgisporangium aliadipatigenens]|uniref:STAS domain-containing protein n=1 Tax=Virgisporangium aliadipatigenens TaxID=741659 RepID=A0A8J3YSJ0_9ACTN|nr:STAS domain-containing protein [Virgisporangium aliadipatigenens]GIJ50701.1 hypothetical protein Val02_75870 [Virgisporangium aliadipatigenens]
MRLQVGVVEQPYGAVITVSGMLTVATMGQLEGVLAQRLGARHPLLIIDLSTLVLCDSTSTVLLAAAVSAGRDCGVTVAVAAPPPSVLHVFEASGVLAELPVYRTVEGASRQENRDLVAK